MSKNKMKNRRFLLVLSCFLVPSLISSDYDLEAALKASQESFKQERLRNNKQDELDVAAAVEKEHKLEAFLAAQHDPELDAILKESGKCNQKTELVTDKSQYNYSDPVTLGMGVSCGGIALMAANVLETIGGLEALHIINLDSVLRQGNSFYKNIIAANPQRKAGFLLLDEIKAQAAKMPDLFLHYYEYIPFGFVDLFDTCEKQTSNVYALCTFAMTTVMIGYNAKFKYYIFFDSHRKNKFNDQGAGYHVFAHRADLICYLTEYPGLRADKKITEQQIDILLFKPRREPDAIKKVPVPIPVPVPVAHVTPARQCAPGVPAGTPVRKSPPKSPQVLKKERMARQRLAKAAALKRARQKAAQKKVVPKKVVRKRVIKKVGRR